MSIKSTHSRKALFLDRDGTLIVDEGYLFDPHRVQLLPHVKETLHDLKRKDWLFFLFSNQSGIGRGYYTLEQAEACNRRLMTLLDLGNPFFSKVCLPTEAPEQPSLYRKPSPRFILECLQEFNLDPTQCWMIGDKMSDIQAGLSARIHAAFLSPTPVPHLLCPCCKNLKEFAQTYLT